MLNLALLSFHFYANDNTYITKKAFKKCSVEHMDTVFSRILIEIFTFFIFVVFLWYIFWLMTGLKVSVELQMNLVKCSSP